MMIVADVYEQALELHKTHKGKIELGLKVPLEEKEALALAYTPGVAAPCLAIKENPETIYDYTAKGNWVAIVTNGTAVLGLGDIGAGAGLPVMEGKAALFKKFGGVDAFPLCIDSKDVDTIVQTVKLLEPSFGGVNLEDIKAPECFEIERRLADEMSIPIFHDDQHGTAIVTLAALSNALRLAGKRCEDVKVVINGAGSAGIAIAKLLMKAGFKHIVLLSSKGILAKGEPWMNPAQAEMAEVTNLEALKGNLALAMEGADVFIGVSVAGALTGEMVKTMNDKAIVFAMANPVPEIFPEEAKAAGAFIVGTGRSDFPNQVNNVLAFPGVFRGALDVQASCINDDMKLAAAYAIAQTITEAECNPDYVIPDAFDSRVGKNVADAVAKAAVATGVARKK